MGWWRRKPKLSSISNEMMQISTFSVGVGGWVNGGWVGGWVEVGGLVGGWEEK